MSDKTLAFGVLALSAVCLAFFSPKEKRAALTILAGMLFVGWFNYVMSWLNEGFASQLWRLSSLTGWQWLLIPNQVIWEAVDFSTGMVALGFWYLSETDRKNQEAFVLYWLFLGQLLLHGAYWDADIIPREGYYAGLDAAFMLQVLVFFYAGGRGFGDFSISAARRLRGSWRPRLAVYRATEE